jgi:hypothetical protein
MLVGTRGSWTSRALKSGGPKPTPAAIVAPSFLEGVDRMILTLLVAVGAFSLFVFLGRLVEWTDCWYQRRRRRLQFEEPPAPATEAAILAAAGMVPVYDRELAASVAAVIPPGYQCLPFVPPGQAPDQATRNLAHRQDFLRERREQNNPVIVDRRRQVFVDPRDVDQVRR